MAYNKLIKILTVGPLKPGESVTVKHELRDGILPLRPLFVDPDRDTAIAVVGTPTDTEITFQNQGANAEREAIFIVWREHSILQSDPQPGRYWRGPGPNGGCCDRAFAYYLQQAGDSESPISVPPNEAQPYFSLGAISGTDISQVDSKTFNLASVGSYEVTWQGSYTDDGQLCLRVDDGSGFTELAFTTVGRTAESQIVGNVIIITHAIDTKLQVCNPSINTATLVMASPAAGTESFNFASLVIKRLL